MNFTKWMDELRGAVGAGTAAALMALGLLPSAQAGPISGTLYFTTFAGGNNIHSAMFDYDGAGIFTLGSVLNITSTPGADGVVFTSDGFLAVGGQGNAVYKVNPSTGAFTSQTAGGTSAFHMMVAPDGTIWSSGIPGEPASYPGTLTANGTPHPLSGSNTIIDTIIWPTSDPTQGIYTSSGSGGFGSIGFVNLTTFTTTSVATGVPSAHGGAYDPFTNTIILFGDSHITQFNPVTLAVVSDLTVPGVTFDQGTVDGLGHIFAATNNGFLEFLDISGSGHVGSPNFSAIPFLAASLDDIAPLVGSGSNPITTPEPGSLALLGVGLLGLFGCWQRCRSLRTRHLGKVRRTSFDALRSALRVSTPSADRPSLL